MARRPGMVRLLAALSPARHTRPTVARLHYALTVPVRPWVFAFLVLIGVLVFRPQGLLGERVGDRA